MKSIGAGGSVAGIVKVRRAVQVLAVVAGIFTVARLIPGSPPFQIISPPQPPANAGQTAGFLTQVSTDKPIYRPGEKVYFRGVVLRADGHVPGGTGTAYIQIRGPKGDIVVSDTSNVTDSIVGLK